MQITLVPTAGLCNRMNAILSAIALNQHYHYPINIYWEKTSDCCAEYTDLFQPIEIEDITISSLHKFYLKPGGKNNLFIPNNWRSMLFDASYKGNKILDMDFNNLIKGKDKIYITAYNRFCPLKIQHSIGRFFRPIESIENIINEITQKYESNIIGVHIRRTDNIAAIAENPIEKFISLMNKEIEVNPLCKFYLASDDYQIKEIFLEKFPNRIISPKWELSRNTVKGMKNAVTELYCLSRTKKIIGCTNSTYSNTASRLYNIPLIL